MAATKGKKKAAKRTEPKNDSGASTATDDISDLPDSMFDEDDDIDDEDDELANPLDMTPVGAPAPPPDPEPEEDEDDDPEDAGQDITVKVSRKKKSKRKPKRPAASAAPQNPLDLLITEGSMIEVERIGPKEYDGEEVQCVWCGKLPATMDIKEKIKRRWGGGTYTLKGQNSRGVVCEDTVTHPGRPLPIDPDAEEETTGFSGGLPPHMQQGMLPPHVMPPGTPPHMLPPHLRGGYPGYPGYGYAVPPPDPDKKALQERLDRIEREKNEAVEKANEGKQSFMETFLGTLISRQEAEATQREAERKEERDRWERERSEARDKWEKERDEERRRYDREKQEEKERREAEDRRLESERKEKEAARKAEIELEKERLATERSKFEAQLKADRERSDRDRSEQLAHFERISQMQKEANAGQNKIIEHVTGVIGLTKQLQEIANPPADPEDELSKKARIAQELVGAVGQAAGPVIQSLRGPQQPGGGVPPGYALVALPDGRQALVPSAQPQTMMMPQQQALPAHAGQQVQPQPGGAMVPAQQPQPSPEESARAEAQAAGANAGVTVFVGDLTFLLDAFRDAFAAGHPPEWHLGTLARRESVLSQMRDIPDGSTMINQLEALKAGGVPSQTNRAITEFNGAFNNEAGLKWIDELLGHLSSSSEAPPPPPPPPPAAAPTGGEGA